MHTLVDLCHELSALPPLTAISEALIEARGEIRIAPLISAARVPLSAALAHLFDERRVAAPILYVVSSSDLALRAAEDMRQWLAPEQVLLYPASDAMPYEHMSPGVDVLGPRLHVVQWLAAARATDHATVGTTMVIIASVKALLQPTLAPAEFDAAATLINRGDEMPQDTLIRRWIDQGYQIAPTVETPGELNRHGGIVDIWPTADTQPLRIEWFGDEIDSLRRFNPQTQRSDQRLDHVVISPPHEAPYWNRARALDRLAALDVSDLRPEARDEWDSGMARIDLGEHFEGRAFFAPFFRDSYWDADELSSTVAPTHSLISHLPTGTLVCFSEALLLAQHAADFHNHAESQRLARIEAKELPNDFPRPYLLWNAIWQAADERLTLADLSNNEFESAQTMAQRSLQPPSFSAPELFGGQFKRLVSDIIERLHSGERVVVVTHQAARIQELVEHALAKAADNAEPATESPASDRQTNNESAQPLADASLRRFATVHSTLDEGWRTSDLNLTLYTDTEIFGWRQRRPLAERQRRKQRSLAERAAFLRGLKPGDYVVHIEHGIAVYDGLLRRTIDGVEREYLNLCYAAGDRIYVPVDQADRVSRYIGSSDTKPQLTRLGTQEWERAKRKARTAVRDLANDLLDLYARRQLSQGYAFSPDNEWQRELEAAFPYIETNDQLRTLNEVKQDMEADQPMDRLICGDVGFGKTEVALRAAFKAVQDGKQVAILAPTTILVQQHYNTFQRRMAAFPIVIEMLSRFRSKKEQEAILRQLARGQIDVIVGTHRLLSKDVSFNDLGLLIVDEEQRFGVRHKEQIKQLRANIDVLTLTATPIPRTLHMAMAGIRDMSVINTAPEDRIPIKSYVAPSNDNLMRDAILRELDRGGQVYVVHNRVHSIYHIANHLRGLVPEAAIGVGHGQLDERQLENVMLDFFAGKYDVLVCTTIIESGLDVPNANTIIIDDAPNYGLAQLHQLRGRVGRSANRAYAYLLYKPYNALTEEAQQRLQAIQEATELGAGFRVAMRDLEIRGAGNLLGAEQSGHIAAVGFDLYSRLLEQAVRQLKDHAREPKITRPEPDADQTARDSDARFSPAVSEKVLVSPLVTLDLPLTAYLPADYIADESVRLSVYQRMVEAQTVAEVRELRQELQDRFGKLPETAANLLTWLHIKALALDAGVGSVITTDSEFIVRLPIIDQTARERLRRRFGRDAAVKIGPQFVRLDRRALNSAWVEKLLSVLEVLGKA